MSTPYSDWLGLEITRDAECSEAAITLRPEHTNKRGVAHGGVVSSLLDTALGAAVIANMTPEEWCATVSLSIQFERPCRGERLVARGRLGSRGKRVAFAEGEVVDERGKVCARAHGVWHIWPAHPDQ